MIDLINRNPHNLLPDEINLLNSLVDKYQLVLNELTPYEKTLAPYLAYVIENGYHHLVDNYTELDADWKTWSIICLKMMFYKNKISDIESIPKIIDNFITHYNKHYQEYVDSIDFSASDYDRDFRFVSKYVNR